MNFLCFSEQQLEKIKKKEDLAVGMKEDMTNLLTSGSYSSHLKHS